MKNQRIGSVPLMTNGRPMLTISSLHRDPLSSYLDHQRGSSISLRIRAALRFRISGPYVSRSVKRSTMATPDRIIGTQLVHRHPRYW